MSIRSIRERHGMPLDNLAYFLDMTPEELQAAEERNQFFLTGQRERFMWEVFTDLITLEELNDDIFSLPTPEEKERAWDEKLEKSPPVDSIFHVVRMFAHSFWADEAMCSSCYMQPTWTFAHDEEFCHRFCMYDAISQAG